MGDLLPAGFRFAYLRPPGGGVDANTDSFAAALGYRVVGWDVDPKDWRRPGADAIAAARDPGRVPGRDRSPARRRRGQPADGGCDWR
ncbi:MAG: hypothetical protein V9H69_07675 [Anaerolineae bacterium]